MYISKPSDFSSNGDLISGWYWCRANGHYAQWVWKPTLAAPFRPKLAAVNFALLVTNNANGGSGFGMKVKVEITTLERQHIESGYVELVNTFRPQVSFDTKGVGYQAYGAYEIKNVQAMWSGFIARLYWPGEPPKYHFAANKEGAFLAYVQ